MANDGKILAQDVIEAKKIVSDLNEVGVSLKSLLAGKILAQDVIEAKKIVSDLNEVGVSLKSLLADMNAITKQAQAFKTSLRGQGLTQKDVEIETQFAVAKKERTRLEKALQRQLERTAQAESKTAKALAKSRFETQKINKENKQAAILTSKYADAYDKLSTRLAIAKRNLKNLIASEKASNREIRKAQKEFEKLDKKVRRADDATKDFSKNVGNYRSAFGGAVSGLKNLVAAFGLYSAIQISGEIYEQIKAIDGMNKALKQVTETEELFNRAQLFTKSVAEESGAELIGLTNSYTKFLASAKTTNLTTRQTENIFRQVAKAAGVLGVSTEDTNGAFRALEQILSKGKVQAEEIRGQLGERLPGAFQILAKSMGLTTQELDKQLKLGNVLSDEVLPAFADELERAYSLDKVERVETMAAAQNRLKNAWIDFLGSVEDGEGTLSKVLKGTLETVTLLVEGLGILGRSQEQLDDASRSRVGIIAYNDQLEILRETSKLTGQSLIDLAKEDLFKVTTNLDEARDRVSKLNAENKKLSEDNAKRIADLKKSRRPNDVRNLFLGDSDELKKNNEQLSIAKDALAVYQGRMDALNSVLRQNTIETDDNAESSANSIKALKEKIKQLREVFETMDTASPDFSKTRDELKSLEEQLKRLLGKNKNIDLTPKVKGLKIDTNDFQKSALTAFKEELKKFEKAAGQLNTDGVDVDFDFTFGASAIESELDEFKKLQEARESGEIAYTEFLRKEKEKQVDIVRGVFNTFGEYYNLDTDAFVNLFDTKKNTVQDYANVAQEANQFILGNALERYDAEIEKNRERLDAILNDESASDKKKELARKKFDEKEKKIRIRQAKAKQDAVLAGIAIDTAAGIVSAFAQVPKYDYGVSAGVLAALIAGTGIAQAAVVKATGLPKFYKGTMFAPEGWAMTDEKGAEIHTDKSGNIKDLGSSKGARYKYLEKGDRIYTAQKSRQLLENFHTISNREILQGFNQSNTASQYVISNNEIKTRELESRIDRLSQENARNFSMASAKMTKEITRAIREAGLKYDEY